MRPDLWSGFIHRYPPTPGRVLITGSRVYEGREDRRTAYKSAFGVDALDGPGVDLVHDLTEPLPPVVGRFQHVECVSVLEHCRDPFAAARNIEEAMTPGATIWLSVPFIWREHAYPNDYWRFSVEAVRLLFPRVDWVALEYASIVHPKEVRRLRNAGLTAPLLPRTEVFGVGRRS